MPKNADLVRGEITETESSDTTRVEFRKLEVLDEDDLCSVILRDNEMTEKSTDLYLGADKTLTEFLADVKSPEINIGILSLENIIKQFADNIKESDELLLIALHAGKKEYDLVSHMLNVSILAIKIGMGLKLPEEELLGLGLAAILDDIGEQKVPQKLLYAPREFSSAEYEEIKKHSLHGYEITRYWGESFYWLAEVILSIHEREDGSGYPHGRLGDEINNYAKIIGLVDTYEALTHNRPHRKRMLHFDAIKYIINTEKKSFPKLMLKTLIQELSTYPLNSYVKLNSGEIAQVVETNPLSPLCPVIKILYNSCQRELKKPKAVNLAQTSLLHIVGSVFEEDLSL